jgi:hypothetical protein
MTILTLTWCIVHIVHYRMPLMAVVGSPGGGGEGSGRRPVVTGQAIIAVPDGA